jgi:peptide/nickel transport system substrate-binding protein
MRTYLLTLALALAASPAAAQLRSTSTFVHLTGRYWHTLDPHDAFDTVSFIVVGNVYESLVTYKSVKALDAFEPFLASQVPTAENGLLSKDRRSYTFPIRAGVRFHDGSVMTAEDVRYSLLRFMLLDAENGPADLLRRPILGGGSGDDFARASSAVRVRGDAVVVTLARPDETFLKTLAALPLVTSEKWAAAHGDWDGTEASWRRLKTRPPEQSYLREHMNGTGPFRFDGVDRLAQALTLARHDGYWRGPAALERVLFKVVPNGGLRLFMLETGDADAGYLESSYLGYAKAVKGLRVFEGLPSSDLGEVFFFNFAAAAQDNDRLGSGRLDGKGVPADFFADPDVRRGFAQAFDDERYFKQALGGKGRRLTGPFPPDLMAPARAPLYPHDAAKAEASLRKALGGRLWDAGFVVTVSYSADDLARQIAAETLKAGLEALNPKFHVHVDPLPSAQLFDGIESRRLPLWIAGYYADFPDAQAFAQGLLRSDSYFPRYQGFSDKTLDGLIDSAAGLPLDARRELYQKIAARAADDLPQVYTYAPETWRACRDWVAGCDAVDNVNNLNFNNFPYFYSLSKKAP